MAALASHGVEQAFEMRAEPGRLVVSQQPRIEATARDRLAAGAPPTTANLSGQSSLSLALRGATSRLLD